MKIIPFISVLLFVLLQSCVATKTMSLHKNKTTLVEAKLNYSEKQKNESFSLYKTVTNKSGATFYIFISQEQGLNTNSGNSIGEQILNTAVRYHVFDANEIYQETVTGLKLKKTIKKLEQSN